MPSDRALSVARKVADELAGDGAEAVVLVGSHARKEAGPDSDVDVLAVGPREFSFRLERRGGLLVSTSSKPFRSHREAFGNPGSVCTTVPGWREAVLLHDPAGIAAALISEARAWTWEPLTERCDEWVAEEITSLAEEIHKLNAALRRQNLSTAAAQRSILAIHLAPILAVHHRILYNSENRLWDLVSDTMGEHWRQTQATALGLHDESFEETCRAALRLYGLAADEVQNLFDERQREVVDHARELAVLAEG